MSQDDPIDPEVHLLPPSLAVYLPGAIYIPVLVQPAEDFSSVQVWVAPVVIGSKIRCIHWSLVLMSRDYTARLEFEEEDAIHFKPGGGIYPTGEQIAMSTTQIALVNFLISSAITEYDINFRIVRKGLPPAGFKTSVRADPAISVTPDPVEIPHWP